MDLAINIISIAAGFILLISLISYGFLFLVLYGLAKVFKI